jgi:hypothetical protein
MQGNVVVAVAGSRGSSSRTSVSAAGATASAATRGLMSLSECAAGNRLQAGGHQCRSRCSRGALSRLAGTKRLPSQ